MTRRFRFMEEVDKEISEMKLSLNSRARIVAESYLIQVSSLFKTSAAYCSMISPSILRTVHFVITTGHR